MAGPVDPEHRPSRAPGDAPPDVFAAVRGRMLVHTDTRHLERTDDYADRTHSGLVISGEGADRRLAERRGDGSEMLLADPARYTTALATKDAPFVWDGQGMLTSAWARDVVAVLQDELANQTGRGAAFALSPTGYIAANDTAAFEAAAHAITEFDNPRMIFTVPLSAAWLEKESIARTVAILREVPGVKALMLGGQMDPLGKLKDRIVANLCALLAQVPDVAVLRTDIAAVGALAHGAVFTSFGVTSTLRHLIPPGEQGAGGRPASPSVLYPQLMTFYLGSTIADRHSGGTAPQCGCEVCEGRPLDRFTTKGNGLEREAIGHNIAVMTQWSVDLRSPEARTDPRRWWRARCEDAVEQARQLSTRLRAAGRKGLEPSRQLRQWAAV